MIFADYEKKTEFILITIFSPTFVPNLVTLAWQMSSGMPKEAVSCIETTTAHHRTDRPTDRQRHTITRPV